MKKFIFIVQQASYLGSCRGLPIEKRGIFLVRFVAQLKLRGSRFTTADLDEAVRLALKGLIQKSAA
jgi:hypothetical protein